MRWDCERQGCFNLKKRPKIEQLVDCLPDKIAFTDVDGLVEVNSNFLFIEWKSHRDIGTGQRILFERLTWSCPATVFIVEGDAETMAIESMAIAWKGTIGEHTVSDIDMLRNKIREWVEWAKWNCVEEIKCTPDKPPFGDRGAWQL